MDPAAALEPPTPVSPPDETAGDKLRLRFSKTGALRFLSHHDLLRSVERMLRRAGLPFRSTQGFHPAPRLIFAQSLSLGIEGRNEVVELELTEARDAGAVRADLNRQAPPGLHFHAARPVPLKATALPRRMVYALPVSGDSGGLAARAAELMAQDKVWVDRHLPHPRRVNIRPFLRGLSVTADALTFDLWVTGFGTARGDELVALFGLSESLNAGAVLTRTELEIHDEVPSGPADDAPPTGQPETLPLPAGRPAGHPLNHPEPARAGPGDDTHAARGATWGPSPNGPAVE